MWLYPIILTHILLQGSFLKNSRYFQIMSGSSCKHPYARRTCAKPCFSGQNEVVAPALMNLGAPPSNERNSFMKPMSNNEPNARSYSGDVRVVFITSQLGLDDLDVGPKKSGLQLKKTGFSHLNGWYWVNSPSTASFFSMLIQVFLQWETHHYTKASDGVII